MKRLVLLESFLEKGVLHVAAASLQRGATKREVVQALHVIISRRLRADFCCERHAVEAIEVADEYLTAVYVPAEVTQ